MMMMDVIGSSSKNTHKNLVEETKIPTYSPSDQETASFYSPYNDS
jgi:hypothetical protein